MQTVLHAFPGKEPAKGLKEAMGAAFRVLVCVFSERTWTRLVSTCHSAPDFLGV